MDRLQCAILLALLGSAAALPARAEVTPLIDRLDFGNPASEQAHALVADNAVVEVGGLGQASRRLSPKGGAWTGGAVAFRMKVDAQAINYVTVRLWGGDVSDNHLTLHCDGKQVGDRLLGDYEALDIGAMHPQYPGAFFYRTQPLPRSLTAGKSSLDCKIDASGPIFAYAMDFAAFQKPMATASRGVYGLYVHTDRDPVRFTEQDDGQVIDKGQRPGPGLQIRGSADMMLLGELRARLERTAQDLLVKPKLGQHELQYLARFKEKTWTKQAQDARIVPALIKGFDAFAAAYAQDRRIVEDEKTTWNPDWFGFGPMGEVLARHPDWFAASLDDQIPWKDGKTISRRQAWSTMLIDSRDWHRVHRRFYTNQSMIVDLYGIYLCNRGVAVLDPKAALPEADALRYLYEAVGLEPWRGDDKPNGGHAYAAGGPDGTYDNGGYRIAPGYHLATRQGLTRELGYVGGYGEVLDWVAAIYDGTRPSPDKPGDARILAQFAKLGRARQVFRYPAVDDQGYRTMRLASEVGWRDFKAPGDETYAQRMAPGGGSALQAAVITRDPELVGVAQQMLQDNQLIPALKRVMETKTFRTTYGLLDTLDDVAELATLPRQAFQLPMTRGAPDFAFTDPEDGVVAVKRGDEIFYASLFWRANRGVNNLGRVYLEGDGAPRIATVAVDTQFTPSGLTWTRPNQPNPLRDAAFNAKYKLDVAGAGDLLPLAKPPEGVTVKPGEDSIYAGKGDFYTLSYGGYVVAMNMSEDKTFSFVAPAGAGPELVSGRAMTAGKALKLTPLSSVVFFTGR